MSAGSTTLDNSDVWRPAINPWIIAVTVTLATFMEVLDTSIANVSSAAYCRQSLCWG